MARCEAWYRDIEDRTKLGDLVQCPNEARYLVGPGPLQEGAPPQQGLCAVHRGRGGRLLARLEVRGG
jgi:hypothetical protein